MQTRVLDLDGSIAGQTRLVQRSGASVVPLREWGPYLRIACRHRSFARFEHAFAQLAGCTREQKPYLTFVGSGDFHHVSLALLRRLYRPVNLLVIDNHPDWMRRIPLLHCGTWLFHAAQLPNVRRIFHLGGEVDFDNAYRWLAPWPLIHSGKIVVAPARRFFRGRGWKHIEHRPLRRLPDEPVQAERIEDWLTPYRAELAARPLYISVDKDVLTEAEAVANWDSGHLILPEVLAVLQRFVNAASGDVMGMDVVGDWSPIHVQGMLRRFLHWTEHQPSSVDPDDATRRNEAVNLRLLDFVASVPLAA